MVRTPSLGSVLTGIVTVAVPTPGADTSTTIPSNDALDVFGSPMRVLLPPSLSICIIRSQDQTLQSDNPQVPQRHEVSSQ